MKDFQAVTKLIVKQLKKNRKQLVSAGQLLFIPLLLFSLFLFLYYISESLQKELDRYDITSFSETVPMTPYPILHTAYTPFLTAQAAAVMDDDSKVFLFVKNPLLRFSMASTTKIMTALVALEAFSLEDLLMVYSEGIEGSTAGLRRGEYYSLESLLYAMLLPSANDAAYVIADNYPGGREAFIRRMNEKAHELHLRDTQYDDPAGLHDDENYTTAVDLAYLSSIARNNETIARITGTREKIITDSTGLHVIPLRNLNELLGMNGVVGIKTGFTQGAGGVLATAKKEGNGELILVVMRSGDRFGDTRQLIRLVEGNVSYISPVYSAGSNSAAIVIP